MKIAVWETGHAIADTVAQALVGGLNADLLHTDVLSDNAIKAYDAHVAYGILRGCDQVFRKCEEYAKPWFNVDRGYFNPGHYNGYYRISFKGTQQTAGFDRPCNSSAMVVMPWRGVDKQKQVLICPPTEHVKSFFKDIDGDTWLTCAILWLEAHGFDNYKVRTKDMSMKSASDDLAESGLVYTFNCSLGWKALALGIPCISDPDNSTVGSWQNYHGVDFACEPNRIGLFNFMSGHQFTLKQIANGHAWGIIRHYASLYG